MVCSASCLCKRILSRPRLGDAGGRPSQEPDRIPSGASCSGELGQRSYFRRVKGEDNVFPGYACFNEIDQEIIRPVLFNMDSAVCNAEMEGNGVKALTLEPAES